MKHYWLGMICLAFVGTASAKEAVVDEAFLKGLSRAQFEALHSNHCGSGASGWYIELDVAVPSVAYVQGGVYTSSGTYYGCGSCAACRTELAEKVKAHMAWRTQTCSDRGGIEHATTTGKRVEKLEATSWEIRQEGLHSKCKTWIPC